MGARAGLAAALFAVVGMTAAVALEEPWIAPDARAAALGGRHAALTDDLSALVNNPAGLRGLDRQVRISELTLALGGPIFDIAGVVARGVDGESVADLLLDPDVKKLLDGLYASMGLVGPVSFAYAVDGLGFGFRSWFELDFDSLGATNLATSLAENYLITGGYAFRLPLGDAFPGTLDVGGALKTAIRAEFTATKSLVEVVDLFGDPWSLVSNEPYALTLGVGIDLGVLYRLGDTFGAGIVARDAFTPTRRSEYASFDDFVGSGVPTASTGRVAPDLSIGVRYSPRIVAIERYASDLKFLLDYNDLLDFVNDPATARNVVLHVGFGVEAVVLDILSLRVGFTDGLPAAGLGLDLGFLDIALSMFGRELSAEPGLRSVYNLILSVQFMHR